MASPLRILRRATAKDEWLKHGALACVHGGRVGARAENGVSEGIGVKDRMLTLLKRH